MGGLEAHRDFEVGVAPAAMAFSASMKRRVRAPTSAGCDSTMTRSKPATRRAIAS